MKASDSAILKIGDFEGLKLKSYKCPAGVWTIGYGHTKNVKAGLVITKEKALDYLKEDVQVALKGLERLNLVHVDTQGKWDALISWVYNLGIGNFLSSTLYKKIKIGAPISEILALIKKWNKAGGKILPGLVKRREWEASIYK